MAETPPLTLEDLARSLNLAVATVSRALNGSPRVTPTTRDRVLAEAQRLGYQPSPLARGLRIGKSGFVGICFHMNSPSRNILISQQLYFLQRELQRMGKRVLVEFSAWDYASKRKALEHFAAMKAEGVIHVGSFPPELMAAFKHLQQRGIPFILINPSSGELPYSISLDRTAAYRKVTRHLLDLGHRRFVALGIVPGNPLYDARLLGICQGLEERGLSFEECVFVGYTLPQAHETSGDLGFRLAQLHYPALSQATVCLASNDDVAAGAMTFLKKKGLRIPEDLSMVGFDNTTSYLEPTLTSVGQEIEKTAVLAVQQLFKKRSPDAEAGILIEPDFIIRESTGPVTAPPLPSGDLPRREA